MAVAALLTIAIVYGLYLFIDSFNYESTDNAYVTGVIVPVSSEVKGKVVAVFVTDNQYVREGTPLLEVFRDDYVNNLSEHREGLAMLQAERIQLQAGIEQKKKALVQARANLNATISEEELAGKELKRYETLLKQDVVSQSHYDRVFSARNVAAAKRESAQATVAEAQAALKAAEAQLSTQDFRVKEADALKSQAQLDLARTVVKAPLSGWIAMKNVDPGKFVQPGQALLSIVQHDTWIVANFKETQIKKMTVGQPVEIKVDAYSGTTFKGHVDSLQSGTGSVFSLLPPENATGNFVKVVQRVPVKIVMDTRPDPAHPLWPGLSVIPSVDIRRATGPKLK